MRRLRPTGCILLPSRFSSWTRSMFALIKQAAGGCSQRKTSREALGTRIKRPFLVSLQSHLLAHLLALSSQLCRATAVNEPTQG